MSEIKIVESSVPTYDIVLSHASHKEANMIYELGNWHIQVADGFFSRLENRKVPFTKDELSAFLLSFYTAARPTFNTHPDYD